MYGYPYALFTYFNLTLALTMREASAAYIHKYLHTQKHIRLNTPAA